MNDMAKKFRQELEVLVMDTLHKAGLPYGQVPDDVQELREQLDEAMEEAIQNQQQEKHQ